jgi:UDP-N-acetylmuramyl pentapeptide phosphotransferase/UDP-N-acetylglucosamine-1-phosphate transferase
MTKMHGGVRILCLPSIDSLSFIFVGFSNAINLTSGLDKVCGMNENTCMTDKELFFITALPARLALS